MLCWDSGGFLQRAPSGLDRCLSSSSHIYRLMIQSTHCGVFCSFKGVMEYQHPVMKAPTPGPLIRLLDSASPYWKGTPSLSVCECVCVSVCVCVCSRCKSVKYSRGEGCSINLATPTFFNLDWQVNCRDGNILSSSRFLSIALRSRVALHHVCQRGLYWRTLRPDWMPGTNTHTHTHTHSWCVCGEGVCMTVGVEVGGGVIILNLRASGFLCG